MERLRRSEVIHARHTEFSPVLFDVLYGLLIFIGIASFSSIRGAGHLVFSVASICVVLHWWMKRKAASDVYGAEVSESSVDLLFGIAQIVLLQMAMIATAQADYATSITYFALALVLESARCLLWRFFGTWRQATVKRIRYIQQELGYVIFLDLGAAAILGAIVALTPPMLAPDVVMCFVLTYAAYVLLTHRLDIIDVKLL